MEKNVFTMDFIKIDEKSMSRKDKRGLSTLYLYYLENKGKGKKFDLPLFVDDKGNGVLSAETFKKVFFAFQCKVNGIFSAEIIHSDDSDTMAYNVVRITKINDGYSIDNLVGNYIEPKITDLKRESSAVTKARSESKKAEAEAEAEAIAEAEAKKDMDYTRTVAKKVTDYISAKFKIKNSEFAGIEADILKIMQSVKID